MKHGDVILSDAKDVCNEFNIYFSSVFKSSGYIKSNFVSSSKVNLNHIYTGLFTRGVFLNFFLRQPIIHIATIA
jgi:hypothetical protein